MIIIITNNNLALHHMNKLNSKTYIFKIYYNRTAILNGNNTVIICTAFEINNTKYTGSVFSALFNVDKPVYLALYYPILHDYVLSCMLLFYPWSAVGCGAAVDWSEIRDDHRDEH